MKAVKDLCIRLINRMTYSKEEISSMVEIYHEKGKLSDAEYADLNLLIKEVYKIKADKKERLK